MANLLTHGAFLVEEVTHVDRDLHNLEGFGYPSHLYSFARLEDAPEVGDELSLFKSFYMLLRFPVPYLDSFDLWYRVQVK